MPKERDVLAILFKTFINSLRPRKFGGTLMGKDHFGTTYYEIPPQPSVGRRKASRWFTPKEKEDFQQPLPAEWEAWLRFRRKEPPTEEEVLKNIAIAEMKKKNAAAIEARRPPKDPEQLKLDDQGRRPFPTYEEYEVQPGEDKEFKRRRDELK